jgi:hypothetical protein
MNPAPGRNLFVAHPKQTVPLRDVPILVQVIKQATSIDPPTHETYAATRLFLLTRGQAIIRTQFIYHALMALPGNVYLEIGQIFSPEEKSNLCGFNVIERIQV